MKYAIEQRLRLIDFLLGEGEIEGRSFGERHHALPDDPDALRREHLVCGDDLGEIRKHH